MHEVCINAVLHGSRGDAAKKVTVFYEVSDEKFTMSVIDEGDGFDYACLPDPKKGENVLADGGRGLYFVRQYMDHVEFNEKGNRVKLVKYHKGRA
jgi:serine/threonine-protein kinase RsbW